MARRPPAPPPPSVSVGDKQIALQRLKDLREKLANFRVEDIQEEEAPELKALETQIARALDKGFGERSTDRNRFDSATDLRFVNMMVDPFGSGQTFGAYDRQETAKNIRKGISVLATAIEALEQDISDIPVAAAPQTTRPRVSSATSTDVFIVHGHDHQAMEAVRGLIQKLGLNPIVLQEAPNGGRTVIEKFEANSQRAGFAVILLTPDDVGGPKNGEMKARARQNVVLELGYFYGALTRKNVCALVRGDVELPSDFVGVVCEPFDDHGAWRTKLAKELRHAGYAVDLNDL